MIEVPRARTSEYFYPPRGSHYSPSTQHHHPTPFGAHAASHMADADAKRQARLALRTLSLSIVPVPFSDYGHESPPVRTPTRTSFPVEQLGHTPLDASCIIDDFLWIGAEPIVPKHAARLKELGVTAIINAAEECHDDRGLDLAVEFKYKKLGCWDSTNCERIESAIERAAALIDEAERTNGRVYVHCRAGRSRSATFAICYLIRSRRMSLKKAYEHVRSRRPNMCPNIGFVQVMRSWERHCLGVAEPSM